ncbi:ribosome small subunit-dependent GTPase A [Caloramator sp. E03]|uniref:ribosome small subunit-dependent GTPase A n=1 Tax=Caloramator sp. E03 TaxID=2576307 RepID=UPI00111042B1|nr:ribosome small subunit-dependent GTPase A [Caloramator sp. E03]QCX32223.1 ribosome small subunit-dependent GTPase A [Caloramator sp. E03]
MQEGIILKGIAGFYYVKVKDGRTIECKARGKFRNCNLTPVIGDRVFIEEIDNNSGVIKEIMDRKNLLIRPYVANIDQAIVVFAAKKPHIVFSLLDKLLIQIEHNNIEAVICINKSDLDDSQIIEKVKSIYEKVGYKVITTNALTGEGIDKLKEILRGKVSVFAGPSGVGKSTLFNKIQNKVKMETQDVSERISRGRHTTRHAEIIDIDYDTYVVDTPGFSSLDLDFIKADELQYAFKEFKDYIGKCKFTSCMHYKETDCIIKQAVKEGIIPFERYNTYIEILQELQSSRRMKR